MEKCLLCICDLENISTDSKISTLTNGLDQNFLVGKFHFNNGKVKAHKELNLSFKNNELIIMEDFGKENIHFFNDYIKINKKDFISYADRFKHLFVVYHDSNKTSQEEALKRIGFPLSRSKTLMSHHGSGIFSQELLIELLLSSSENIWEANFNNIIKEFPSEILEDLLDVTIFNDEYDELDNYLKSVKK